MMLRQVFKKPQKWSVFKEMLFREIEDLGLKSLGIIMFISFFNVIQVRWMNTIYIFAVLRKIGYKQGRFNSWEEHFRIAPAIGLSISLLLAWWAKAKNTVSKGRLFLSMAIVDYILIKKGFLKVKNYFVLPLIYFILIFTLGYSKRWVYESSELK